MATDAVKFGKVLAAAQESLVLTEPILLADVLAPDAALTISADQGAYVVTGEMVLHGILNQAGSTALTAATPVNVGTLIAACRPPSNVDVPGRVLTSAGALAATGTFTINATTGLVTFTPDTTVGAATNEKFHLHLRFLLSDADATDIV